MRFVVRPQDIGWLFDMFKDNQYVGIGILCSCLLVGIIVVAVSSTKKRG